MPLNFKLNRISLEAAAEAVNRAEEAYVHKPDFVDIGIEPKIRPAVIALVAHGFPTTNSCEGHLDRNLYPYVVFSHWPSGDSKDELLKCLANASYQMGQLENLLAEFYEPYFGSAAHARITGDRVLDVIPAWKTEGAETNEDLVERILSEFEGHNMPFRLDYILECKGARTLDMLPRELLHMYDGLILQQRQRDMLDFVEFLVSKL